MPFQNDREFWIFVQTVLHTAQRVKDLDKQQVTALAEYIRGKFCPNLTYEDWLDVEKSIIESKYSVMNTLAEGLSQATGGEQSSKAFEELRNLDSGFRESVEGIDVDSLQEEMKKLGAEGKLPDLTKVIDLVKDFKKERKDFKKE